ncbi:MAG TPA: DUF2760 domain-containing protein [Planctomycetaceae bacterium]|nr:DUF2760 domain-containing protein [Planctomycetaceae bacterium]
MRLLLAFRVFWATLFHAETAAQVERVLSGKPALEAPPPAPAPAPAAKPEPPPKKEPPKPVRSEALTLLATLQREARFLDFVMETLDGYDDAQVGAVVRDIHRDCGKTLNRLFALRHVVTQEEGTSIEVPADVDRYRLVGNVTGQAPFRGTLVHAGWEAAHCDVPTWTGNPADARVVAPAEVELK